MATYEAKSGCMLEHPFTNKFSDLPFRVCSVMQYPSGLAKSKTVDGADNQQGRL